MFVVMFQGGLGNQMFQYAFYSYLKKKFGDENVFADIRGFSEWKQHNGFELKRIFDLTIVEVSYNYTNFIIIDNETINLDILDLTKNYLFRGYFQTERYIKMLPAPLFTFQHHLSLKNIKILKLIENTESVSVHVRRGDYATTQDLIGICDTSYFERTIKIILNDKPESVFYFFSDDPAWCKQNLHIKNAYYIDWNRGENSYIDLLLCSRCASHILSNSSFSWWSAYLESKPEKKVYYPERWFNDEKMALPDFIPESWNPVFDIISSFERKKAPFFSIIIPVYNTERYIRRCLKSLNSQTFENIEILIIDDCSPGPIAGITSYYQEKDKRIIYIKNACNESVHMSRKKGVSLATGQFILFLDSDDWLEETACSELFLGLQNEIVDIFEFGYNEYPGRKPRINISEVMKIQPFDLLVESGTTYTLWNKCYSSITAKEAFSSMQDFYTNVAEDLYESCILLYFAKSYKKSTSCLYNYVTVSGISSIGDEKSSSLVKWEKKCRSLSQSYGQLYKSIDLLYPDNKSQIETMLQAQFLLFSRYLYDNMPREYFSKSLILLNDCFPESIQNDSFFSVFNGFFDYEEIFKKRNFKKQLKSISKLLLAQRISK